MWNIVDMWTLQIFLLTYIYFRDLEKYDVELLFSQNMDYEKAFAMTSELIVLEILNRVFICIFEVSDLLSAFQI